MAPTPRKQYAFQLLLFLAVGSSIASAQSEFPGRWQTKTNAAGESSIAVIITVQDGRASGKVVLTDLHSRIEMPISKAQVNQMILEFETTEQHGQRWYWTLSLTKGQLHGSVGEMLIDERVTKRN